MSYNAAIIGDYVMAYVKPLLSGFTAICVSLCVPGLIHAFQGIRQEKATGIAVLWVGLLEAALSPLFWIVAGVLFASFFTFSRLESKALRVVLFWVPSFFVLSVVIGLSALIGYAYLRFHQG